MLWETIGKPAYEKGLLEGRQEGGLFAVIPLVILENKDLSANAKLLYAEIVALSKKSGRCYATNEYLANILSLKRVSIPRLLRELITLKLITITIQRSLKGTYRDIWVTFFSKGGDSAIAMGGIANEQGQKRNRQIEINKIENTAKQGFAEITQIIKLFEGVDAKNKTYYGNTTQRKACSFLIGEYGMETVSRVVEILPETNKLPYFPSITSPYELKEKWSKLGGAIAREKKEKDSKLKTRLANVIW